VPLLILNGPTLNLLGTREPDTHGTTTLSDIELGLKETFTARAPLHARCIRRLRANEHNPRPALPGQGLVVGQMKGRCGPYRTTVICSVAEKSSPVARRKYVPLVSPVDETSSRRRRSSCAGRGPLWSVATRRPSRS